MEPIRLENWSYAGMLPSAYAAPEQAQPRLCGQVFGHPKYPDGTRRIFPSVPIAFDLDTRIFRGASGRLYKLGKVDEKWEAEYPDAENRFVKSLAKMLPQLEGD